MPISIDLSREIADAISTDSTVQSAISAVLKTCKVNIPPSAIDDLKDQIKSELPSPTKTAAAADVAKAILDQLDARVARSSGSSRSAAIRTKALATSRAGKLAKSKDDVYSFLWKYCAPGLTLADGKQNVRICGPAGASKTWRVRKFGALAEFDLVVEVPCLSDMEPRDFIAGPVPGEQTTGFRAPFVDGPLAKAWRAAAAGQTVLVILDEIGNVPKSAKQAFQSCLSPFGERGSELSKLSTGRAIEAIDSKGNLLKRGDKGYHEPYIEEIDAPFANISIVGTQNVGSEYDCPEDSPAITARLMPKYVKTDAKLIRDVVGGVLKEDFTWSKPVADVVVKSLIELWKGSVDAKNKSLLAREISVREMMMCVNQISGIPDDVERVTTALQAQLLSDGVNTWFVAPGHSGDPQKEQCEAWNNLVSAKCPIEKKVL
jgi:hypothetical protein